MEVVLILMKIHFNLIFFPNPSTGTVYLSQNMLAKAKVEIKTILGKRVYSQTINEETHSMNLSSLEKWRVYNSRLQPGIF